LERSLTARGVRIGPDGRVVIEVRDLGRRNQTGVEELLARHPDAVLVEMGVPAYRPPQARAYVATHGSARVLADAAAATMAAR
jgi:beta-N-acetylhexosaminidase